MKQKLTKMAGNLSVAQKLKSVLGRTSHQNRRWHFTYYYMRLFLSNLVLNSTRCWSKHFCHNLFTFFNICILFLEVLPVPLGFVNKEPVKFSWGSLFLFWKFTAAKCRYDVLIFNETLVLVDGKNYPLR